jgi:hypothetical protein
VTTDPYRSTTVLLCVVEPVRFRPGSWVRRELTEVSPRCAFSPLFQLRGSRGAVLATEVAPNEPDPAQIRRKIDSASPGWWK